MGVNSIIGDVPIGNNELSKTTNLNFKNKSIVIVRKLGSNSRLDSRANLSHIRGMTSLSQYENTSSEKNLNLLFRNGRNE